MEAVTFGKIHLFAYGFYECSVFFMLITVKEYSIGSEVER